MGGKHGVLLDINMLELMLDSCASVMPIMGFHASWNSRLSSVEAS